MREMDEIGKAQETSEARAGVSPVAGAMRAKEEKLGEIRRSLKELAKELQNKKAPALELEVQGWLDDHDGKIEITERHGFPVPLPEIKELLKVAEIEADCIEVYATVEDGITVWGKRAVENEYGREIGHDHFVISLSALVERAMEVAEEYSIPKVAERLEALAKAVRLRGLLRKRAWSER